MWGPRCHPIYHSYFEPNRRGNFKGRHVDVRVCSEHVDIRAHVPHIVKRVGWFHAEMSPAMVIRVPSL